MKMTDNDKRYCDNINCNHNDTNGLCCLFNPDNCKYRQLQKENAELKENNSFLNNLVKEKEQRGLEVQEDLLKENAELKNRNAELKGMYAHSAREAGTYKQFFEQKEKENAELKHTIAELRRDKDNLNTHTKAQEKLSEYRSDQLTKAKEIIKKLIEAIHIWDCKNLEQVEAEAEQFLKEVEE